MSINCFNHHPPVGGNSASQRMSGHMLSIVTCVHHSRWSTSGPRPVNQNPSNLIPSHIPKRFICHATVAAKLYTSKKGKIVKDYLEQEGLKACAAKTKGVDDAGAESAEVVLVMDLDFIASVSR